MGASVDQANTYDAIRVFMAELSGYQREGMKKHEMNSMRLAYTQSDALSFETPSDKAGFLRHIQTYELAETYRDDQLNIIKSIERQELNQLAAKLKPEDLVLVVVGDSAVLKPQLEKLERKIEALTVIQ